MPKLDTKIFLSSSLPEWKISPLPLLLGRQDFALGPNVSGGSWLHVLMWSEKRPETIREKIKKVTARCVMILYIRKWVGMNTLFLFCKYLNFMLIAHADSYFF